MIGNAATSLKIGSLIVEAAARASASMISSSRRPSNSTNPLTDLADPPASNPMLVGSSPTRPIVRTSYKSRPSATTTDSAATPGTSVEKSTAVSGGGIYNNPDGGIATVTLDPSSSVSHNTATGPFAAGVTPGGGILNLGTLMLGTVAVTNSTANGVVTHNSPDNIDN
jgi:hypothetical protein